MKPTIIAIVGRTNVGKSTLFNRIIEESKALVSEIPGTTRDIQTAATTWRGETFLLVDTGGLDTGPTDEIKTKVRLQAEKIIKRARLIIFVVDTRTGLLPQDKELARDLLRAKKPLIFVANKADSAKLRLIGLEKEWLGLGLGSPMPISAVTGIGVGDLLDNVFDKLQKTGAEKIKPAVKIAIIGKPNVGKSSLLNAIVGEERFITSSKPHTTREPVDTLIFYSPRRAPSTEVKTSPLDKEMVGEKIPILLVDTAGIRKRARVTPGLEQAGVSRSLEAVRRADIVLLVLDLSEPVGTQDKHLAGLLAEKQKGVIILGNKWDLVSAKFKNQNAKPKYAARRHESLDKTYKNLIYKNLPMLNYAPVIFTSALERKNVHKILEAALTVYGRMRLEFDEKELLKFWEKLASTPIAGGGVRHPRLYSFKQTWKNPPRFHIAVRERAPLNPAYLRFLEKKMREWYDLEGVPIQVLSKNIKR